MDTDDPDDLDPEKARSALEQLEAEKQRRIQARIDAGELRVVGRDPGETLVVGSEEMIEEAVEKAEAEALDKYGNNPPLHFDFEVIVTGVVRARREVLPRRGAPLPTAGRRGPPEEAPVEGPAEFVPVYCAPPQPPAYLYVTVRQATDATPGHIAGRLLRGHQRRAGADRYRGQLISSRRLKEGQEPLDVAREMLRKTVNVDQLSFTRDIRYPKGGVA